MTSFPDNSLRSLKKSNWRRFARVSRFSGGKDKKLFMVHLKVNTPDCPLQLVFQRLVVPGVFQIHSISLQTSPSFARFMGNNPGMVADHL